MRRAKFLLKSVAAKEELISSSIMAATAFAANHGKCQSSRTFLWLRLNIEAVLRLTKYFLPPMVQRRRGRILNVGSIAGFNPGPLLSVYHATKAFVNSWSEALATELKDNDCGVTVTTLCPGPTDTDFFPKAGMVETRAFQKASVSAPQDVAKAGYEGLMKGELFVVPGMMNKALVASRRILSDGAQASLNEAFYKKVPPEDQKRERGDFEKAEVTSRG